jgi:hypothetical protein
MVVKRQTEATASLQVRRSGAGKGEVKKDAEGMQTMRTLATNMAFLLQKIHAGGNSAPQRDERPTFTNFIR